LVLFMVVELPLRVGISEETHTPMPPTTLGSGMRQNSGTKSLMFVSRLPERMTYRVILERMAGFNPKGRTMSRPAMYSTLLAMKSTGLPTATRTATKHWEKQQRVLEPQAIQTRQGVQWTMLTQDGKLRSVLFAKGSKFIKWPRI